MLSSLVLCSVAIAESLPTILERLWYTPPGLPPMPRWIPPLIWTPLMAIFAEILPQYLIPRRAMSYGYICLPVVWFCMIITSPVSLPLACILDNTFGRKDQKSGITHQEVAALINFHRMYPVSQLIMLRETRH